MLAEVDVPLEVVVGRGGPAGGNPRCGHRDKAAYGAGAYRQRLPGLQHALTITQNRTSVRIAGFCAPLENPRPPALASV